MAANAQSDKNGTLSWQECIDECSCLEVQDELIDELVDLIEHELQRGGFLGVSEKNWKQYEERIQQLIIELQQR